MIVAFLAALHIAVIWSTPYWPAVTRDLVWSGYVMVIMLLASGPEDSPLDICHGLLFGVAVTASIVSLFGLLKYWLQLHGIIFSEVLKSCGGTYPQGSTLCSDYNMFSLFMLIGAIGTSYLALRRQSFLLSILVAACFSAAMLAGSRRFVATAVLVPLIWLTYGAWRMPLRKVVLLAISPVMIVSFLYYALDNRRYQAIPDSEIIYAEDVLGQLVENLGLRLDWIEGSKAAWIGKPYARTVLPDALAGTLDGGLKSRIERWKFSWQMIQEDGYIFGRGFRYHREFACHFVKCEYIDYPHAPLLAAWVAFGLTGLFLAIAFYGVMLLNVFRAGKEGILSGATPIALAVLPYSLISGDTILSLPHALIGAMLVEPRLCPPRSK